MSADPHQLLGQLSDEQRAATELLSLLAFCAPEPLPTWALAEHSEKLPAPLAAVAGDERATAAALAELRDRGLLEMGPRGLAMPAEIAMEARARLGDDEQRQWCVALLELLHAAVPCECDDVRKWDPCASLLPHALTAIEHAEAFGLRREPAVALLDRAAVYMHSRGQLLAAHELARRAVADVDVVAGSALEGTVHYTLGCVQGDLGEVDAARAGLERALAIHEELLDPAHPDVILDRTRLAELLVESDQLDAALGQLERAIADREGQPMDRPGCAALRMLGWVQIKRGDAGARAACEHAVGVATEVCGDDHPDTASARICLGVLLEGLGELEEARGELEKALEAAVRARGDEHPQVAAARSNLGSVLRSLGYPREALPHLEKALAIGEATLPGDHLGLLIRHRKLAAVLQSLDEPEAARQHAERVVEISERALGSQDPRFAGDLAALAGILNALHRRGGARDTYRRALEVAETALGPDHADVAMYETLVGRVQRGLGELPAAREHFERALGIYERAGEAEQAHVLTARVELARVLAVLAEELAMATKRLGRGEEAERMREEARAMFAGILEEILEQGDLGSAVEVAEASLVCLPDLAVKALERGQSMLDGEPEDPSGKLVGAAWHRLGRSRKRLKDGEGAERAFQAAIPLLAGSPQFQGVALHDIGELRFGMDRFEEASDLYQRAAERKREAGENPRDLAITLLALGRALEMCRRYDEALVAYNERMQILTALPERDLQAEGVTFHDFADAHRAKGELQKAAELYQRAAERKREAGENPRDLAITLQASGRALEALRRYDEALVAYDERMEILTALPERDLQAEGVTLHDIADAHRSQGELRKAAELYRQAAERKREADRNPRDLAITLLALGRALEASQEYSEALTAYEECLAMLTALPERDLQAEGVTLHDIADVIRSQGESQKAAELYRRAAECKREAAENSRDLAITLMAQARSELDTSDDAEAAVAAAGEAVELLHREQGDEPDRLASATALHAEALIRAGDPARAVALLDEAERILQAVPGHDALAMAAIKEIAAGAYDALGQGDEAAAARERATALKAEAEPA